MICCGGKRLGNDIFGCRKLTSMLYFYQKEGRQ